jgi:hypothetical protein
MLAGVDLYRGVVAGPRGGSMRDRRGRGRRGPLALPGPLSPRTVPVHRPPRAEFDLLVADAVESLRPAFEREPQPAEVVVEEVPILPEEWDDDVPLSLATEHRGVARVVLFRLPLTHRSTGREDLADLVMDHLVDRLAEVWQVPPDDLDPRPAA